MERKLEDFPLCIKTAKFTWTIHVFFAACISLHKFDIIDVGVPEVKLAVAINGFVVRLDWSGHG